jgi:maltodextrin utilization protein YvdJ
MTQLMDEPMDGSCIQSFHEGVSFILVCVNLPSKIFYVLAVDHSSVEAHL